MATIIGGERSMRVDTTPETIVGVPNGSPTYKPFRARGGGIGMKESLATFQTEEHANSQSQPAPTSSNFEPSGSVGIIPSPYDAGTNFGGVSFFRFCLASTITRISGQLVSYSFQDISPGILTRDILGVKFDGMSLSMPDSGKFLAASVNLRGLHAGRLATPIASGAVGTFPSSRDWKVANMSALIGADLTVNTSDRTMRNLQINLANNCKSGAPVYYYPGALRAETRRYGVATVDEGQLTVTGSFEVDLADASWFDRFAQGTTGAIRVLGWHPDSLAFTTGAFSSTANPTVTITEDFTVGQIAAGNYVYLEDASASDPTTWKREVLKVKTETATGGAGVNTVQFETDGATDTESTGRSQSFTSGTRLLTLGLQLRIPQFTVTDFELIGGVGDRVRGRVSFIAGISGSNPILGYMVR